MVKVTKPGTLSLEPDLTILLSKTPLSHSTSFCSSRSLFLYLLTISENIFSSAPTLTVLIVQSSSGVQHCHFPGCFLLSSFLLHLLFLHIFGPPPWDATIFNCLLIYEQLTSLHYPEIMLCPYFTPWHFSTSGRFLAKRALYIFLQILLLPQSF